MIKRINETQKNLLDNSYTKSNKISEIEKWARDELKNANKEHIDQMRGINTD
jgi:hypothetical protein